MSTSLPNLTWLRTFEAAARLRNFTAAGEELGLTQAAVSQHIKSLEAKLGCALFLRQPRNLQLSEMGKAYLPHVRRALDDLSLSTLGLFGPEMVRAVTLRVPVSTAVLWLAPKLSAFQAMHPGIELRLVSTIWADSLEDQDVDIDIRSGHGDWPGLRAEKISNEAIVPVCPAGEDTPISAQTPLHILGQEDNWARYGEAQGVAVPDRFGISVDTSAAALEMIAAGQGVAVVLARYARAALEAGRPVRCAGPEVPVRLAHYLVERDGRAPPRAEVATVRDWVKAVFAG
ncbi:LysR substrate-binding domain-containing protein [uncultured Roseovarius sp.]|uniref:LysR substrate-binding domain-containing protein n=1 Tax=uncultured Roseovarius sp. TaxID=293344 RepID=UPI0025D5AC43|nr:LysR substrate-binding domain-containing protein [uncultured Roseovarius sp.]